MHKKATINAKAAEKKLTASTQKKSTAVKSKAQSKKKEK
tara:strand:- start:2986 stop:3102 length:117 start_codon:yes stop_codon:yes gene_type:complete